MTILSIVKYPGDPGPACARKSDRRPVRATAPATTDGREGLEPLPAAPARESKRPGETNPRCGSSRSCHRPAIKVFGHRSNRKASPALGPDGPTASKSPGGFLSRRHRPRPRRRTRASKRRPSKARPARSSREPVHKGSATCEATDNNEDGTPNGQPESTKSCSDSEVESLADVDFQEQAAEETWQRRLKAAQLRAADDPPSMADSKAPAGREPDGNVTDESAHCEPGGHETEATKNTRICVDWGPSNLRIPNPPYPHEDGWQACNQDTDYDLADMPGLEVSADEESSEEGCGDDRCAHTECKREADTGVSLCYPCLRLHLDDSPVFHWPDCDNAAASTRWLS